MKKTIKALIVTSIVTIVLSIPVFAQEVTDPKAVIKEETFVAGEDALANEFHNSEVWRSENYVKYLDGVIYNLQETVRIKKEIVTNYTELAKVNPYFQTLLPNAIKNLEEAQTWVDAYKEYKKIVQADLEVRYKY